MLSKLPKGRAAAFLGRVGIVSGMTLLSRVTGFLRDIVIAGVLGNGVLADAFFIALRLPNHFRAIFAEGAFNAAFVPTYAGTLAREGFPSAQAAAGRIIAALMVLQLVILVAAEVWTREFLVLLTPDFAKAGDIATTTVTLTRITFPYLAAVTLVTAIGAVLNAHQRFAAVAAAPILFNAGIVAGLFAAPYFPTPAHAAATGVAVAGLAEIALVWVAAARAGIMPRPVAPALDPAVRTFLRRVGPAVIGSGASQIAMLADTILAASLPVGAVSALYYADRLYQLPVGVIAVALGTVLLPELSERFAKGDVSGARAARRRALIAAAVVTLPFVAVFTLFGDELIRLVFAHGAFRKEAADRAGDTLQAYGLGLMAVVMLRPVVAGFHARGDTRTPMLVALGVLIVNVGLKIALTGVIDVQGLALATSAAAWCNLAILFLLSRRMEREIADGPDQRA
ncbi:murein biosynthesis integral membrane protein MurJ [Prosthecomicrobium sp. N25]|uniref:murein biosynthesis integral membrane protein MurJ n=1 Tax=Prosthecomicrobium sp. N25 TaxID=3129254 RepID=UPI00307741C4